LLHTTPIKIACNWCGTCKRLQLLPGCCETGFSLRKMGLSASDSALRLMLV
jgi:hypothetical protein